MKYNADLFKLIKSLTKSEKRYFKIYAAQQTKKESNNYILLFDAIDRQDTHNEEKLRRKFRNHTFGKNLAKTKYLLYELIIKMLLQLRQGKDIDSKIRLLIDAVKFHYSKSLYDQALISLQKAKKLAAFFEHYNYWIEALNWEIKLFGYVSKKRKDYTLKSINRECRLVEDLRNHEMRIGKLLRDTQILAESTNESSMNELVFELETLFQNRLITKNKAKTFLSKLYILEILVLQALASRNFELAFLHLEEAFGLWNNHPEKVAVFPHDFIRFCTNYMRCSTSARRKGIFYDELLGRLLEMGKMIEIDSDKIFFVFSMHDFIFNLVNDNFEVCSVQIFTIKDLIDSHVEKLNLKDRINLFYHISVFYFIKEEYRETLNWIKKIQKIDSKNEFSNLQGYCLLLSVVSKYEEKELDELESALKNANHFLKTRIAIQPIEKLILTYIRKLINVKHSTEEMTLLTQLFNSLQNINDGDLVYKMIVNNAICQWVEGKITNKNIPLLN